VDRVRADGDDTTIAGRVPGTVSALWDSGDDGGMAAPVLTSTNAGPSTVHSPYYYSS
jgi:hypothetical protein